MSSGEGELPQARPAGRRRRVLRVTVLGMLVLVALLAVGLRVYRSYFDRTDERPTILAKFARRSPVADGVIGPNEYGPPITITWTEDSTLAAFQRHLLDPTQGATPGDLATAPIVVDPTRSKTTGDLSLQVSAAYSSTSLFLAFRVRDQFVDAQESDRATPQYNDGVEVFIDGDHVANDFRESTGAVPGVTEVTGTREGFQVIANAAGHQLSVARDFTNADWKAASGRVPDGYVIEMEIPLSLIDTQDGPPFSPAGAGSLLHFGMAVTDNDAEVSRQTSYAYLRTPKQTVSPWMGREGAWNFGIKLESRWSLLP